MGSFDRADRMAKALHESIAEILRKDVSDPIAIGMSVTSVEVSKDHRIAKVFYVRFNSTDAIPTEAAHKRLSGFIRRQLAKTCQLRFTPEIRLIYDRHTQETSALVQLIESANSSSAVMVEVGQ